MKYPVRESLTSTNSPSIGDRGEGFYIIVMNLITSFVLDVSRFGQTHMKHMVFTYGKLPRIYVDVVLDFRKLRTKSFWVSRYDFSSCESGNIEGPAILMTCASGNTIRV